MSRGPAAFIQGEEENPAGLSMSRCWGCQRPPTPAAEQDLGLLSHLSLLIADEPVELLPLQAQEVLPWQQDATLGGDGAGSVDVVPCHHPDSDPRTLALQDSVRHLGDKDRVRGDRWGGCWVWQKLGSSSPILPEMIRKGPQWGQEPARTRSSAQCGAHPENEMLN